MKTANSDLLNRSAEFVLRSFPYAGDFFLSAGIRGFAESPALSVKDFIDSKSEELLEDIGMDAGELSGGFIEFLNKMEALKAKTQTVSEITILGGRNKSGGREDISLTVKTGEIVTVMGPTGSGKSRLLADIECLAQEDTQTKRKILINGREPTHKERFQIENKLIAQLSQNMNFVMDLPVMDFIRLHGESRMIDDLHETVSLIYETANSLAGERFSQDTPLTQLSGGQSRALMIADAAYLSLSPVVLIDEIENAGVDRKRALELLAQKQKIVLMSTHDPILALMGDRRIIIENGGIKAVLETSEAEKENLLELEAIDRRSTKLLQLLRSGQRAETKVSCL